jgi:hypothetical protein
MAWQPPFAHPAPPARWTPPPYLTPQQPPGYDSPAYGPGPVIDGTAVEVHPPGLQSPAKPSIDGVPTVQHSRIDLAAFVKHKVAPVAPGSLPYVETMHWHFDEPHDANDHEVRLFLVLSQEERALIWRWGLQHHAFEQETLFDDQALEALQGAQRHEIDSAADPQLRASLAIEHKQQLAIAREAKVDITIEDYLAYPFRRQFVNRYQATNGQKKLQGIVNSIRKMLEEHRER